MDESQTIRVSVEEAATLLGIEKGSVKKRIQRGKLRPEKDASGQVWVYLDRSETVRDQSQGRSETDRDELLGELRDRIAYLERQVGEERESRRRADTIIAQLSQANAALAARVPELEAPPEVREEPETAAQEPDRGEPHPDTMEHSTEALKTWTSDVQARPRPDAGGAQEGVQRPWWRRMFGG